MNELTDLHLQILEKCTIECSDIEEVLGDLVDNELTPTLNSRVRDHITGCRECQASEASYRWVIECAHDLSEEPAPVDVQNRLRATLNARLGLTLAPVDDSSER